MANFYTNVQCLGGSILYRGINDGKRVKEKINYRPSLFVKNKSGNFRTLEGYKLEEIKFESIKDAKNFVKGYEGKDPVHEWDFNQRNLIDGDDVYR